MRVVFPCALQSHVYTFHQSSLDGVEDPVQSFLLCRDPSFGIMNEHLTHGSVLTSQDSCIFVGCLTATSYPPSCKQPQGTLNIFRFGVYRYSMRMQSVVSGVPLQWLNNTVRLSNPLHFYFHNNIYWPTCQWAG